MTTVTWVTVGAIFVLIGTLIMWYFPYREDKLKDLEKRESGKFSKRISFKVPVLGNGSTRFTISGEDHTPFITDGKGRGILYIPTKGSGDGIIYTWIQDNEMKISLTIYDKQRTIVSYISGNEWVVNKSTLIDCNYDLENFEVVSLLGSKVTPLLQIQLKHDRVILALETYLKDGTCFFFGNNRMEYTNPKKMNVDNDLRPLFLYPSDKNFGKRN